MHKRSCIILLLFVFSVGSLYAQTLQEGKWMQLPGMKLKGMVTRDANGIAHVTALDTWDLFYLQGYVEATDRFFQMDFNRKVASGRLAEILGSAALSNDVQLRTLGLRRAAEASLDVASPEAKDVLEAFSAGVNQWLSTHALPSEYGLLHITKSEPWSPADTLAIAKLLAFNLAFDLGDIDRTVALLTYEGAGKVVGFNGDALFFEDLFRTAPFSDAATMPDAGVQPPWVQAPATNATHRLRASKRTHGVTTAFRDSDSTLNLAREYAAKVRNLPSFRAAFEREKHPGSNEWGIAGSLSSSGNALLANDPHLSLGTPSTFYPIYLQGGGYDVAGETFAGAPAIILGHNQQIEWGETTNFSDVTDVYQEQLVPDPSSPSGYSSIYQGKKEPVVPIPETFKMNAMSGSSDDIVTVPSSGDVPPVTLVVPRHGPIVQLDTSTGEALSVQFTGLYPTHEIEAFIGIDKATNLDEFQKGLQYFDFGSQNFAYADRAGHLGYFTAGEVPIREDLQAMSVNGAPPMFIRDGMGGNEWMPVQNQQPGQAIPYEILPASEMPHLIDPPNGFFVNANNDPTGATLDNNSLNQIRAGGGLYYFGPGFDGFRAGRITQLIQQKIDAGEKFDLDTLKRMQADTVLLDAEYFVPKILQAWQKASASTDPALAQFAANPVISAAIQRLQGWNYATPTGIPQGYDGTPLPPDYKTRDASVAATLYTAWRSRLIANTIDAVLDAGGLPRPDSGLTLTALEHIFDVFDQQGGVGASGINFFNVDGVSSAADRRDIIVLASLGEAMQTLSSAEFAPAFGESTNLDDYEWGKLHRLSLAHVMGWPFSIPMEFGSFPPPLPGLPGIPVDGGFETVDASSFNVRNLSLNGYMYGSGPARRFVGEAAASGINAQSSLPGGVSGIHGNPLSTNLLVQWLKNETYDQSLPPAFSLPWMP
ncbi:MAG: penicillin acylase family protein [Thermoanaerobaculia bacterium]